MESDEAAGELYVMGLVAAAERRLLCERMGDLEISLLQRIEGIERRQREVLQLIHLLYVPVDHLIEECPRLSILSGDSA